MRIYVYADPRSLEHAQRTFDAGEHEWIFFQEASPGFREEMERIALDDVEAGAAMVVLLTGYFWFNETFNAAYWSQSMTDRVYELRSERRVWVTPWDLPGFEGIVRIEKARPRSK